MTLEDLWIACVTETGTDPTDDFAMSMFYAGATAVLVLLESAPDVNGALGWLREEIIVEAMKHRQ